jgi:prepilin-type N-terminal cleavage/methylation domain-containing protein
LAEAFDLPNSRQDEDKSMKVIAKKGNATRLHRGFSYVELMVVMAILTIVVAVLTDGMIQIQAKSANDVNKVGSAQESRQFMDQILRDLRQSGFPSLAMFDASATPAPTSNSSYVANGLVSFSSTTIQFEGDIDGSGVSEVYIQAFVPAGGSCPCTVQRGTVSKALFLTGGTPAYYTELDNVMSQNIFTAYKTDGSAYDPSGDQLSSIVNIGVALYVRNPAPDTNTQTYSTTTMVSEARINN